MSRAQRIYFLQDVIQRTAIALVSVINHYHINGFESILRHPVLKIIRYEDRFVYFMIIFCDINNIIIHMFKCDYLVV